MIKQLLSILAILTLTIGNLSAFASTSNFRIDPPSFDDKGYQFCVKTFNAELNDSSVLRTSDGYPIVIVDKEINDATKYTYNYISPVSKVQVNGLITKCQNGKVFIKEIGVDKTIEISPSKLCFADFIKKGIFFSRYDECPKSKRKNIVKPQIPVQKLYEKPIVIDEKGDVGINTNSYQCKDKSGKEINPFTNSDGTKNYFSSSLVRLESEKNDKKKFLYLAFSCMVDSNGITKVTINKNKTPVVLNGGQVEVARSTGPIKGSIISKK
jgi:hypothetical protein